jgi:hypothetical protein
LPLPIRCQCQDELELRVTDRWRGPSGALEQRDGFQLAKAALTYERDQESSIRTNTYVDPRAGQITLTEWVNQSDRELSRF